MTTWRGASPRRGGDDSAREHGRLPWFLPDELTEQQRAYYDELTSGPRDKAALLDERGRLQGAFNARLLDPIVGAAIQNLGAKLRFETHALTGRQRELAILEVALSERSDFEWTAHQRPGLAAGLRPEELDAIRTGADAPSLSGAEALVRTIVRTLIAARDLDDEQFERAAERLGLVALFDLISLVGHYQHTALALRVWRVPLAAGDNPVFEGERGNA